MTPINELRADLERLRTRQEVLTRVAVVFVVTSVVLVTALAITLLVSIRHSSDVIVDCTTVGGDCYQRGQDQTAKAVRTLEQIVIASNVCSAQPQVTLKDVQACVTAYLGQQVPQ